MPTKEYICKSCGKRVYLRVDDEDLCQGCVRDKQRERTSIKRSHRAEGRNFID